MIETVLKEASIYRSGCIVKRTGTVHLEAGSQTVMIGGLKTPAGSPVPTDSVRLYVPDGVAGNNVQVETPKQKDITKATAEINDKILKLEDDIEALDMQRDLWTTNSNFTANTSVTAEGIASYIEKLPERLSAIYTKRSIREKELKKLKEEQEELIKESAGQYIKAELTAAQAGDYPFEISYYVEGVAWSPFYEIHTGDDTDSVSIRLRANIIQATGEDWVGVKLSLYSADPSISGTIPVLRPSFLSFYAPSRGTGRFMGAAKMAAREYAMEEAMVCDEAPMMEEPMNTVTVGSATVSNDDTAVEYILDGLWDIASEREIICDLTEQSIKARMHVITVPKIDPTAFLAAEVAVSDIEQLYDTEAAVYIKGAFMGNVYISPDMSKDNYDISLGKDETVKVERKQIRKYSSNVMLKGQRKTELEYEITVTSRKAKDASVTVIDQIPVTTDKTITVEAVELSGAEHEEQTGELRWNFELPAGEKAVRKLAYNVTFPKDKTLIL